MNNEVHKKQFGKRLAVTFFGAALAASLVSAPIAANAATAGKTYLNGWTYDYWAQTWLTRSGTVFTVQVSAWKDTRAYPAGYVGLRNRSVNAKTGSIMSSNDTNYNPRAVTEFGALNNHSGSGPRYGYSKVLTWNGNGYTTHYPTRTPNVN